MRLFSFSSSLLVLSLVATLECVVHPGFPRQLSPKAEKIFEAVSHSLDIRPEYSPISKKFIAASGRFRGDILDYGNTTTFVTEPTSGYRKLIMEAKEEVLLATFIYAKDNPTADGVRGALIELNARQKAFHKGAFVKKEDLIRVYVSMDPVGAEVFAKQPAPVQSHLTVSTDIKPQDYNLPDPETLPYLDLRVRSYHRGVLGTMHDKFMVIDGTRVLLGSKNIEGDICEEYMLQLDGSVANSMRQQFIQAWGRPIPELTKVVPPTAPRPELKNEEFPVIMMGRVESKSSFKFSHKNAQVAGWLKAMEVAQKSVYIQTLNFCTERAADTVVELAKRGIQVTISTSYSYQDVWESLQRGSYGSNKETAKIMYKKLPKEFHKNLRVCWWMGSRIMGDAPKPAENEWTHTKSMIIDDEIVIIGSANMDPPSWYHQHEFNVCIDDVKTTKLIRNRLFANQRSLQFCYHGEDPDFIRSEISPAEYGPI